MSETIQYPYSKASGFFGVLVPLVFFGITFNNLRYSYLSGFKLSWMLIAFADLIFLSLLLYMLFQRLIPALQNKIALKLSEDGITDHIRNIVIEWSDIQ